MSKTPIKNTKTLRLGQNTKSTLHKNYTLQKFAKNGAHYG